MLLHVFCPSSETTAVTEIGPYKVPEGIVVWPMIYALQNSINNWEDPEDFNPVSDSPTYSVRGFNYVYSALQGLTAQSTLVLWYVVRGCAAAGCQDKQEHCTHWAPSCVLGHHALVQMHAAIIGTSPCTRLVCTQLVLLMSPAASCCTLFQWLLH